MHDPLVPASEPFLCPLQLWEHDPCLQQRTGFHGQPVGALFVVGVMVHQKVRMHPHGPKEESPPLPVKRLALPEGREAGNEGRVDAHGGLNVAPGIAGILMLPDIPFLIPQKILQGPASEKRIQEAKRLPRIALIARLRIRPCQGLPEDEAVQTPAPLVVVGRIVCGIQVPVHLPGEGVAVEGMSHDLLGILQEVLIPAGAQILKRKKIGRVLSCSEMAKDRLDACVRVSPLHGLPGLFQGGMMKVYQGYEFLFPVHMLLPYSFCYFRLFLCSSVHSQKASLRKTSWQCAESPRSLNGPGEGVTRPRAGPPRVDSSCQLAMKVS